MRYSMEPSNSQSQQAWNIRNAYIPLPPNDLTSDYKRLLFVGRTGSGKTTLVRQLLGVPHRYKFPPTSPNRTTVADFEALFTEKGTQYKCIITFFDKNIVYEYIKECLYEAAKDLAFHNDINKAYTLFMEHKTQRFRLKYILGDPIKIEKSNIDSDYKYIILSKGKKYQNYIKNIAENILHHYKNALAMIGKKSDSKLSNQEKDEIYEYLDDECINSEYFRKYCDDIIDDIVKQVFNAGKCGNFQKDDSGWPQGFTYENNKLDKFISNLLRFCGNSAEDYGRLVTPVVSGVRISGPFHPSWCPAIPKIVVMDGEGVGHKVDRNQAISTSITEKYALVNNIILIDSATESMLNEAQSAILSIITHGYSEELILAFTKFDSLNGPNFLDDDDKKEHIIRGIQNFADDCNKNNNQEIDVKDILDNIAYNKIVFLSSLDQDISAKSSLKEELLKLLQLINVSYFDDKICSHQLSSNAALDIQKKTIQSQRQKNFRKEHAIGILKDAIQNFQDNWDARLNFASPAPVRAEHWSRIKALTRRISEFGWDNYDDLNPIADIVSALQKSLFKLLKKNKVDKKVLNNILKLCSQENHGLCRDYIIAQKRSKWYNAYHLSGTGSTGERARIIQSIYRQGMPVSESNNVIIKIIEIVINNYD